MRQPLSALQRTGLRHEVNYIYQGVKSMEFGVCLNVVEVFREDPDKLDEQLSAIAAAGYTYIEIMVAAYADADEDEINAIQALLQKIKLKAKRANVLFPGDMKVVGPERNEKAIREYLDSVFQKLKTIGVEIVVFGSGGARRIPDGFPYNDAYGQLCDTIKLITDVASGYGIKVALEHLNPKESNLLTTIKETVNTVRDVNLPTCGFVFDIYHVDKRTNDIYNVLNAKDILFHSHVGQPGSRIYPFTEGAEELRSYFEILKGAGYDGTVSVEAALHGDKTFKQNMTDAYKVLTDLSA